MVLVTSGSAFTCRQTCLQKSVCYKGFLLQATLGASNGVLHLPLIKNKKTVNPRDSSTPAVFQLETAMGSAIECFDDAGAVVVPRARFAPVKTTNDLFGLRSDAFKVPPIIFLPLTMRLFARNYYIWCILIPLKASAYA